MEKRKDKVSPGLRQFEELIRQRLRMEIAEHNLPQKEIVRELEKMGISETTKGLSAKMQAGTFSAAYYEALLQAIETLEEKRKT